MSGGAYCCSGDRAGLVSNQDPDEPFDKTEPLIMVAVCARGACQTKQIKRVAGETNRRAYYFDDAERRARREAS
jgi:hypothetical protein